MRHSESGVADRFLLDLKDAFARTRASPGNREGVAPIYGLATRLPVRGAVREFLERYVDLLYDVADTELDADGSGDRSEP